MKICGITSAADARAAVDLGVNAVGVLVGLAYASADALSAREAGTILAALPPFVCGTLVTHLAGPAEVRELCRQARPQAVQLHGPYPVEGIAALREALPSMAIITTVHVEGEDSLEAARRAAPYADAILLDTRTATRLGGTGLTHDWAISRRIRDAVAATPVILAGGLTPANVASAIRQVRPYAVDVNSGVSLERGRKSPALVEAFVHAARNGG